MNQLLNAWQRVKERPLLLVFGSITDAIFFISIGLFTAPVSTLMIEQFSKLAQEFSKGLAQSNEQIFTTLATSSITFALLSNIAIYFAILFTIYTIFQGTSWYIAHKYFRKTHYLRSILNFFKINLFWFALYVIYKLLDFLIDLRYRLLERLQPETINIAGHIMLALFFIGLGLASFSCAREKTFAFFRVPIKKSSELMITGALLFFIPYSIFYALGNINLTLSIILSAFILLPMLTYLRVYLMEELNVHTRN